MPQDSLLTKKNSVEQLEAIKANDERTLKALYQENFPKIQAYVLANNGTADQAKDVYQEAFIAVWRNIQLNKFQPDSETAVQGYLYQVAKNKWLDYLRSGHYTKTVRVEDERLKQMQHEDITEAETEYIEMVKSSFLKIGDNCKELLTRFYYAGESMKQIALAFGWTEASARNNKYRCVEKLRALIKERR
jgi:RNA polymerase sigma factor (sigma-70 family)